MGAVMSGVSQTFGDIDVETPKHEVVRELTRESSQAKGEIRKYPPAVAIEISFTSETEGKDQYGEAWKQYRSQAFRTLAAYIGVLSKPQNRSRSGEVAEPVAMTAPVVMDARKNDGEPVAMTAPVIQGARTGESPDNSEPIAMTAPVIQGARTDEVSENSERIAMTAPVIQDARADEVPKNSDVKSSASKGTTITRSMQFLLPSKYTMDTAPTPTDPRVKLVEIPERYIAVNTFSGRWDLNNVTPKRDELFGLLDENSITYEKEQWSFAAYNPPWTPGFLRTNEIFVPVHGTFEGEPKDANSAKESDERQKEGQKMSDEGEVARL